MTITRSPILLVVLACGCGGAEIEDADERYRESVANCICGPAIETTECPATFTAPDGTVYKYEYDYSQSYSLFADDKLDGYTLDDGYTVRKVTFDGQDYYCKEVYACDGWLALEFPRGKMVYLPQSAGATAVNYEVSCDPLNDDQLKILRNWLARWKMWKACETKRFNTAEPYYHVGSYIGKHFNHIGLDESRGGTSKAALEADAG